MAFIPKFRMLPLALTLTVIASSCSKEGPPGPQGAVGSNGTTGVAGQQGPQGRMGDPGAPGVAGADAEAAVSDPSAPPPARRSGFPDGGPRHSYVKSEEGHHFYVNFRKYRISNGGTTALFHEAGDASIDAYLNNTRDPSCRSTSRLYGVLTNCNEKTRVCDRAIQVTLTKENGSACHFKAPLPSFTIYYSYMAANTRETYKQYLSIYPEGSGPAFTNRDRDDAGRSDRFLMHLDAVPENGVGAKR